MAPDTQEIARKPRNWEALKALESVTPPSPSPSLGSDVRANFCSIGEIPIILDIGIQSSVSTTTSVSSTLTALQPRLPASSSSATLETVGTFGPRRPVSGTSSLASLAYSYRDNLSVSYASLRDAAPASPPAQSLSPQQDPGYYDRRRSDVSAFTLSTYVSPSRRLEVTDSPVKFYQSSAVGSATVQSPPSSSLLPPSDTFKTTSSLSTLLFAPGFSPMSPASTSDISSGAQRRFATAQSTIPSGVHNKAEYSIYTPPGSPSVRSRTPTQRSIKSNPSSPTQLLPSRGYKSHARTTSTSTVTSNGSSRSAQSDASWRSLSSGRWLSLSKPQSQTPSSGPHAASNLPGALSWLEDVTIELWIDQEGFRFVRPAFRLATYSGPSSSDTITHPMRTLTHGRAEFLPIKTQSCVFHHAPLDPLPVLRKMVMAGDDTRDYISRQASLAIKSNGVYSVSGTETFDPGPSSPHGPDSLSPPQTGHHPTKLTWRFEYAVDDIRPGSPPRGRQAERRLTPLSFSCSPGLLHPSHGKKIRLMQVVKKGLTPKLTSAKVEDARLPPRTGVPVDVSPEKPLARGTQQRDTYLPEMSYASHRRAHSTLADVPTTSAEYHDRATSESEIHAWGIEKNRATSVVLPVLHRSNNASPVDLSVPPSATSSDAGHPLLRHILPPTTINHLLDENRAPPSCAPGSTRSLPPPPWRHVH